MNASVRLRAIGMALLAPLIAVVVAVLATTVVIAAAGSSPGDFWTAMFSNPLPRIRVNIVNQAAMIYIAAVSAAIGFRMGLFNIGVEGQYTIASFAAASFAGAAFLGGFLNVVAALVVAVVVGAAWAGIAGILKTTRGVSEVISTIMLNAIAVTLVGYLLNRYGVHEGNTVHTDEAARQQSGSTASRRTCRATARSGPSSSSRSCSASGSGCCSRRPDSASTCAPAASPRPPPWPAASTRSG